MKYIKYLSLFAAIGTLLAIISCEGTDEPDSTSADLISFTWVVSSVEVIDGVATTDRSGFTFRFQGNGSYTFNTPNSTTGTWEFKSGSNDTVIILDGNIEIEVTNLTETTLGLQFEEPTFKDPNRKIKYNLIRQ